MAHITFDTLTLNRKTLCSYKYMSKHIPGVLQQYAGACFIQYFVKVLTRKQYNFKIIHSCSQTFGQVDTKICF